MTSEKVNSEFKIIDTVYTPTFDGVYVETHLDDGIVPPGPEPIAPEGAILIFANPQCTEYADGQSNIVYVRFNLNFGINDGYEWSWNNVPGISLRITTPSTEYPDASYKILLWATWKDNDRDLTKPFASGEVVKVDTIAGLTVNDPQVIFSQEIIAPEGKVQVFADPYCTRYADGLSDTVYVRLNLNFGFGEGIEFTGASDGQRLIVGTPVSQYPEDPYFISSWTDWLSQDFDEPFVSGQVIECVFVGSFSPQSAVENPKVIFE